MVVQTLKTWKKSVIKVLYFDIFHFYRNKKRVISVHSLYRNSLYNHTKGPMGYIAHLSNSRHDKAFSSGELIILQGFVKKKKKFGNSTKLWYIWYLAIFVFELNRFYCKWHQNGIIYRHYLYYHYYL